VPSTGRRAGADEIALLCIMLILDEFTNVRIGIFAPQWSRAGTGYTMM